MTKQKKAVAKPTQNIKSQEEVVAKIAQAIHDQNREIALPPRTPAPKYGIELLKSAASQSDIIKKLNEVIAHG